MLHIRCHCCKTTQGITVEKIVIHNKDVVPRETQHLTSNEIIKEVSNIGWFLDKNGTICPTCYEVKNGINIREELRQAV